MDELLSCPDLTTAKKSHLLREREGLGQVPPPGRTLARQERLASSVRKIYRSAFKTVTGLSSRGYSREDVAAVLRLTKAEELIDAELLELAREGFAADRLR